MVFNMTTGLSHSSSGGSGSATLTVTTITSSTSSISYSPHFWAFVSLGLNVCEDQVSVQQRSKMGEDFELLEVRMGHLQADNDAHHKAPMNPLYRFYRRWRGPEIMLITFWP